jgi:chemotaxis protein CheC
MTSDAFVPLTDLERDALAELSNIAMARASNSLRQMIQNEVLLAVPSVEILTGAAATKLVAKPNNPKLVAVRQDFVGAFSGRALQQLGCHARQFAEKRAQNVATHRHSW